MDAGAYRTFLDGKPIERWPLGPLWHFALHQAPGSPIGASPIEYHRHTVSASLAAQQGPADFEVVVCDDGGLPETAAAVVAGLTYNFLPFMVLPIYVSLEKIDKKLLEAGPDLYANGWRTFRKVTLPLSLPGLFAGSLLTFIPASGDFINVEFVGSDAQRMIGNVVANNFVKEQFRPGLSALSFVLMAIILLGVLIYARLLGTEDLL